MIAKAAEILNLAKELSGQQRAELAAQLLAEADGAGDADWLPTWTAEIERRSQDLGVPAQWSSWAATLAATRSSLMVK